MASEANVTLKQMPDHLLQRHFTEPIRRCLYCSTPLAHVAVQDYAVAGPEFVAQRVGYSGMPWPPADPNHQWPV